MIAYDAEGIDQQPEEPIAGPQRRHLHDIQTIRGPKRRQGFKRVGRAKAGVAASVDDLQGLHNVLDVHETPGYTSR